MFVFRKIWRALLAWNTSFKIRSFCLITGYLYAKEHKQNYEIGSI